MADTNGLDPDFEDIQAGRLNPQDILAAQKRSNEQSAADAATRGPVTAPAPVAAPAQEATQAVAEGDRRSQTAATDAYDAVRAGGAHADDTSASYWGAVNTGVERGIQPTRIPQNAQDAGAEQSQSAHAAAGYQHELDDQGRQREAEQRQRDAQTRTTEHQEATAQAAQQREADAQARKVYAGQMSDFEKAGGVTQHDPETGDVVPQYQPQRGDDGGEAPQVPVYREGIVHNEEPVQQDGQWLVPRQDTFGNRAMVPVDQSPHFHEDAATGAQTYRVNGEEIALGTNPTTVERNKLQAQRVELERGETQDHLDLADARLRLRDAKTQLAPFEKPAKEAQSALDNARRALATATTDAAKREWNTRIAEKQAILAAPEYVAAKTAHDQVDDEVRAKQDAINQRRSAALEITRNLDRLKAARLLPDQADARLLVKDAAGEWPADAVTTQADGRKVLDPGFAETLAAGKRSQSADHDVKGQMADGKADGTIDATPNLTSYRETLESLKGMGVTHVGDKPIGDEIKRTKDLESATDNAAWVGANFGFSDGKGPAQSDAGTLFGTSGPEASAFRNTVENGVQGHIAALDAATVALQDKGSKAPGEGLTRDERQQVAELTGERAAMQAVLDGKPEAYQAWAKEHPTDIASEAQRLQSDRDNAAAGLMGAHFHYGSGGIQDEVGRSIDDRFTQADRTFNDPQAGFGAKAKAAIGAGAGAVGDAVSGLLGMTAADKQAVAKRKAAYDAIGNLSGADAEQALSLAVENRAKLDAGGSIIDGSESHPTDYTKWVTQFPGAGSLGPLRWKDGAFRGGMDLGQAQQFLDGLKSHAEDTLSGVGLRNFRTKAVSALPFVSADEIVADEHNPVEVAKRKALSDAINAQIAQHYTGSTVLGSVAGGFAGWETGGALARLGVGKLAALGALGEELKTANDAVSVERKLAAISRGANYAVQATSASFREDPQNTGIADRLVNLAGNAATLAVSQELGGAAAEKLTALTQSRATMPLTLRWLAHTGASAAGLMGGTALQQTLEGQDPLADPASLATNFGIAAAMGAMGVRGEAKMRGLWQARDAQIDALTAYARANGVAESPLEQAARAAAAKAAPLSPEADQAKTALFGHLLGTWGQVEGAPGTYAARHDALNDLRGQLETARANGDGVQVAALKDQVEQAQGRLASSAAMLLRLKPEVATQAAKLLGPGVDATGLQRALAGNDTLRLAAVEIGRQMRGLYLGGAKEGAASQLAGDEPARQAAIDQLVGAHAVTKDLAAVLGGAPIESDKAAMFEQLGLAKTETLPDGRTMLRVTSDALPLLPEALREKASAQSTGDSAQSANLSVSAGSPGAITNHLAKAGEERVRTAADGQKAVDEHRATVSDAQTKAAVDQQAQAEADGKGVFEVPVTVEMPGIGQRLSKVRVAAGDEGEAMRIASEQAKVGAPKEAVIRVSGKAVRVGGNDEGRMTNVEGGVPSAQSTVASEPAKSQRFTVPLNVTGPDGKERKLPLVVEAGSKGEAARNAVEQARKLSPDATVGVAGEPVAHDTPQPKDEPQAKGKAAGSTVSKGKVNREGEARAIFEQVHAKWAKDLGALGFTGKERVDGTDSSSVGAGTVGKGAPAGHGPLGMRPERDGGKTLTFHHGQLVKLIAEARRRGVSPEQAVEEAIVEEVIHAVAVDKVSKRDIERIAATNPELRAFASKTYGGFDGMDAWRQGHEMLRMVVQGDYRGRITETLHQALDAILKALGLHIQRLPANALARKAAATVQAALEAHGIDLRHSKVTGERLTDSAEGGGVSGDEPRPKTNDGRPGGASLPARAAAGAAGDGAGTARGAGAGDGAAASRGERGAGRLPGGEPGTGQPAAGDDEQRRATAGGADAPAGGARPAAGADADAVGEVQGAHEAGAARALTSAEKAEQEQARRDHQEGTKAEAMREAGYVPLYDAVKNMGGLPSDKHRLWGRYGEELRRVLVALQESNKARKGNEPRKLNRHLFRDDAQSPDDVATRLGFDDPNALLAALEGELSSGVPHWVNPDAHAERGADGTGMDRALGAARVEKDRARTIHGLIRSGQSPEQVARDQRLSLAQVEQAYDAGLKASMSHFGNAGVTRGPEPLWLGAAQVYHGTPHEVDRFSTDHIGEGEGNQAYGWGLYFAEKPEVAEQYRKAVSERDFVRKVQEVYDQFDAPEDAVAALDQADLSDGQRKLVTALQAEGWWGFDYPHQAVRAALRQPQNFEHGPEVEDAIRALGNTYTVKLNAEDHELLDWDKPLSEQSEKVKDTALVDEYVTQATGGWNKTGSQFYSWLQLAGDHKKASELLRDAGIPGIRYLDQGSRNSDLSPWEKKVGMFQEAVRANPSHANLSNLDIARKDLEARRKQQTHNYVVFDDSRIEITHRNGEPVDKGEVLGAAPVEEGQGDLFHESNVDHAATEAHPEPTDAQKEAGNYRKGHARISGLDISIENPAGSTRSGQDRDGKPWSVEMGAHYGYIRGTEGKDGDHVDVMIKPGTPEDWRGPVYVVNQVDPRTRRFDEHKAILGAESAEDAERIYRGNYAAGWDGLGSLEAMPFEAFKQWANDPTQTQRRADTVGETAKSTAELVKDNYGLAVTIANSYRNIPGVEFDDILGEARVALVKAARGFDPAHDSGQPFGAYAGAAIRNTLNNLFAKQRRIGEREVGSADEVHSAQSTVPSGDDEASAKNTLVDPNAQGAVSRGVEDRETRAALDEAMAPLPERVKTVLTLAGEGKSLREIGEAIGLSHEMARRILDNGRKAVEARLKERGFKGVDADGVLYSAPVGGEDPDETSRDLARTGLSNAELTPLSGTEGRQQFRAMVMDKRSWEAAGRPDAGAEAIVDRYYRPEAFAKVPEGALLVPLPSTSGGNTLPNVLARRIAADRGGQVIEQGVADPLAEREVKHKKSFWEKIDDPVAFQAREGIEQLRAAGRPVWLVEDVHNTGETWQAFRDFLREQGVPVEGVATLAALDTRMTDKAETDRFARHVAAQTGERVDKVRPALWSLFRGRFAHYFDKAQDAARQGPEQARRLLALASRGAGAREEAPRPERPAPHADEGEGEGGGGEGPALGGGDKTLHSAPVEEHERQIGEEADRIEQGEPERGKPADEPAGLTWAKITEGRLDYLNKLVPGAKALMLDAHLGNARFEAALRTFRERMMDNVRKSFGYPSLWRDNANRARMERFTAELLPTAARLNAVSQDSSGKFTFEDFWMRAGHLPGKQDKAMGLNGIPVTLAPGVFIAGRKLKDGTQEKLRVKELVQPEGKSQRGALWQLERFIPAAEQAELHAKFHETYPEAAHWLDSWVNPNLKDSRVQLRGVELPDFNRFSERAFWNEVSPFGPVAEVKGYTPDVFMTRSLVGMVGQRMKDLLKRDWMGPGREYKSGEARERGQVMDLFSGFNVRAAEAHMERSRRELAEGLLGKALKQAPDQWRPGYDEKTGLPPNYVKWSTETVDQLLRQHYMALGLDPKKYQRFEDNKELFSPEDRTRIEGFAGKIAADAAKTGDLMIHKDALAELRRPLASQYLNSRLLRVLDGAIKRVTAGNLANTFTLANYQFSNEIFTTMHAARKLLEGVYSLPFDQRQGKLGLYEAWNLTKGMITDRWYNKRVRELVPDELFEGNHRLSGISISDFEKSPLQLLAEFNAPGAVLKLMHYGKLDIRVKQRVAYASYLAHARLAWDDAQAAGKVAPDANKAAWMKDWVENLASDEIHRQVYETAVLIGHDYNNVPMWMDEKSRGPIANMMWRGFSPYSKYWYNLGRQGYRYTIGSGIELMGKGRTPQQRRAALANITMMVGLGLLARNWMSDEEEGTPRLGRSVDDLGKKLEGAYNTSGRVNITHTAPGRILTAMLDCFGLHDLAEEDKWLRVRSLPYASSVLALSSLMEPRTTRNEMEENAVGVLQDTISEGLLAKLAFANLLGLRDQYDQGKNLSYLNTDAAVDLTTSGVVPPPLLRMAKALADPIPRRTRPVPSLNYDPGVLAAIENKVPGLGRELPTGGSLRTARDGSPKAEDAIAESIARGLPEGNFRRYVDPKDGRAKVAYVMPSKVQVQPRIVAALRALGLNVKFLDHEEYVRELAALSEK